MKMQFDFEIIKIKGAITMLNFIEQLEEKYEIETEREVWEMLNTNPYFAFNEDEEWY